MATIDRSTDTVTLSCAEYDRLMKVSPDAPPSPTPFDYDEAIVLAKARFDETCSPSYPDIDKAAWTKLQERLLAWQSNTYGVQPFERQVMGIVEEFGELAAAASSEDKEDGVADVVVFSSQLAACWRLDLDVLMAAAEQRRRQGPSLGVIRTCGRGCHVALKTLQGIRGMGDESVARAAIGKFLIDVLSLMASYAAYPIGKALWFIVSPVAEKVMLRTKQLPQVVP